MSRKGKDSMNSEFYQGIWFSVQFLVVDCDMPTMAKDLIKSAQLSREDCISLQKDSGSFDDEMKKFINIEIV